MRVRVIRAHPLQDSFNAAIHARAVAGLARAGHELGSSGGWRGSRAPAAWRAAGDHFGPRDSRGDFGYHSTIEPGADGSRARSETGGRYTFAM